MLCYTKVNNTTKGRDVMKNILVIGIITCDVTILGVDALPKPGDALAYKSVSTQCGGTAANAAMDLAKLGLPVTLVSRIGSDLYGELVAKQLASYAPKLNCHLTRDETANTTLSFVCVNHKGERAILTNLGATFHFNVEDIPEADCRNRDICFISGALLLKAFEPEQETAFLRRMQQQGTFTCMDTCYDTEEIWLPKIESAIQYLDLFMPSYNECVKLTGLTDRDEIADFFLRLGAKNVVIKLGSQGAYLCKGSGERLLISSYNYKECIDTTGAGDSFCAGLIAGLASGLPMEECVRLGNMVGATCVSAVGGQAGLLPLEETLRLMEICQVNGGNEA